MLSYAPNRKAFARSLRLIAWCAASGICTYAVGAPYVEFDFARSAECRDVTLAERRSHWQAPAPRYRSGVLAKYAALVSSASEGAVTDPRP